MEIRAVTILVDDPIYRWRGKLWCHMVSTDSAEELHAFAAKLGLKRQWSQERPKASAHHYDITEAVRYRALLLGAKTVTSRVLVLRNYDGMRARGLLPTPDFGEGGF